MLLLLLSHFSRVRLCATPETAAHQASPSLGFSRQEHWSGVSFPSPMHESEKWKWSRSVVSNSSDPMDCSLPGSSVHGIFQAKVLESGAIAFSGLRVCCLFSKYLEIFQISVFPKLISSLTPCFQRTYHMILIILKCIKTYFVSLTHHHYDVISIRRILCNYFIFCIC